MVGIFLVFIFTLVFIYSWQKQSFWKQKGIATPSFYPIIGHLPILWANHRWEAIDKVYKLYKVHGLFGIYAFSKPELVITDPNLFRLVMVKEADHFTDRREIKLSSKETVFSEMLTMVKGEKWKALRSVMTPTFTSGKIKSIFPLILSKVNELVVECGKEMEKNSYVEIKSLFSYYTMDVIGTSAFGIDANCLKNKGASQFIVSANYLASVDFKRLMKIILFLIFPKLFEKLGINFQNEHMDFFKNVVKETVDMRIKSGEKRGDFLDILIEALEESKSQGEKAKYPITMNTITSESILFILAGFDTTSNALSFLAYLLAKNPDAQNRLRNELREITKTAGELNYQNVMESKYLDACLSEALRLYSPAHFTERQCTKSFKLPERDLEIPEGMIVMIPVHSIHTDPEYWEDPHEFRPHRFLPENKDNIKPYSYMPFGLGPRNCIAMRFAQLEVKLAIANICLNYKMELRPGFNMVLGNGFTTLRPNKNGVQVLMNKI